MGSIARARYGCWLQCNAANASTAMRGRSGTTILEVLLANNYLGLEHGEALRTTFPTSPWWGGGSFWMRRRL